MISREPHSPAPSDPRTPPPGGLGRPAASRAVPSLAASFAALALAAGCAGSAPPPESPAGSGAPVTPAAARPQASSAPALTGTAAPPPPLAAGASLHTVSIPVPPPPAEPPGPLTRTFTTVTLPGVKRSLVSVEGRGPNDLWFLTYEEHTERFAETVGGEVLHFDGKRVKSHGHPCSASMFGSIVVSRDAVVALGYRPWSRGVAPRFRASLVKDRTWNCDEDDGGYTMGLTTSAGDHVWELSCHGDDCRLRASGGPPAPLPTDHPSFGDRGESRDMAVQALFLRGLDDGWMVRVSEDRRPWLLRFNGVTWRAVAALEEGMFANDLWAEGEDVWIVLGRGSSDAPSRELLRWNGKALSLLPVPKGFTIHAVRAHHGKEVWFTGEGRTLYQWDGAALRRGEAPFEVNDLWAGPGGEVWIVGPPTEVGGPPPGTVARAVVPDGTASGPKPRRAARDLPLPATGSQAALSPATTGAPAGAGKGAP